MKIQEEGSSPKTQRRACARATTYQEFARLHDGWHAAPAAVRAGVKEDVGGTAPSTWRGPPTWRHGLLGDTIDTQTAQHGEAGVYWLTNALSHHCLGERGITMCPKSN